MNQKSQGTAIFMALLMVAIVAAIAVTLARTQQIDIRRTQMMIISEQGYLYTNGVIGWAVNALTSDLQTPLPSTSWPLILPPTPIADGQGKISGILQDAEGLFNINNFVSLRDDAFNMNQENTSTDKNTSADSQTNPGDIANNTQKNTGINASSSTNNTTVFSNLLSALHIELSPQQQLNLIAAIKDWISPYSPAAQQMDGGFDPFYSRMNPPYQSSHRLMVSVSELRTVAGMTPIIYNRLLPYIIALPQHTDINAAHAPRIIQQALGFQTNTQTAASMQKSDSKFFLLRADVYLEDQHIVLYSLLQRSADTKNPNIKMLWKSLGSE